MYRKIIVPVDLAAPDKGERILKKAAALLDDGGEIVLVNVVEDLPNYLAAELPDGLVDNAVREGQGVLTHLRTRLNIPARIEIRGGAPAREILAAAVEHEADLIVVGSHVPDLSNYFIGATADRVVRHAKCSVLVDR